MDNNSNAQIITADVLLDMNTTNLPMLIKPILPKVGVVAIAGSSDVGKSSFLRSMATAIVTGQTTFLGFEILANHKSVIYVSTEDDSNAISYLLNKAKIDGINNDQYRGLRYIFDTEDILNIIETELNRQPADCVCIDAFGDLYSGEMNQSNQVRSYLNKWVNLAKRHNCLLVFLHHTGKRTDSLVPSKDNLLGTQGFEAKMRLVIELRKDVENPKEHRHLCIVKGNYLPEEYKTHSFKLKFNEKLMYESLDCRVPFQELVPQNQQGKSSANASYVRAKELRTQGLSYGAIATKLKEEGFDVSKSTIGYWLK